MAFSLSDRTTLWAVFLGQMMYIWVTWTLYENPAREEPLPSAIAGFLLSVSMFIVGAFRCRALNWSPWRVLAYFVPIAGFFLLVMLLFKRPVRESAKAPGSGGLSGD